MCATAAKSAPSGDKNLHPTVLVAEQTNTKAYKPAKLLQRLQPQRILVGLPLFLKYEKNEGTRRSTKPKTQFHCEKEGGKCPARVRGVKTGRQGASDRGIVRGWCWLPARDPRRAFKGFFLHPSGLAAHDQLLPVELFVEQEDQEVDIYFSSVKQLHDCNAFIL